MIHKLKILGVVSWQVFSVTFFGTVPLWYPSSVSGLEAAAYSLMLAVDVFGGGAIAVMLWALVSDAFKRRQDEAEMGLVGRRVMYVSRDVVCRASAGSSEGRC